MIVLGMDIGFVKTGCAVIDISKNQDKLLETVTLESDIGLFQRKHDYVVEQDGYAINHALMKWFDVYERWKPVAVFAEIPTGGAQGARANRCMGMATGMIMTWLFLHRSVEYELYLPSEVEKALKIDLKSSKGNAVKLTKGKRQAFKKQRMREQALKAFPHFKDWPKLKGVAEDSYDAVCAFLCGRECSSIYTYLKGNA